MNEFTESLEVIGKMETINSQAAADRAQLMRNLLAGETANVTFNPSAGGPEPKPPFGWGQ